MTALQQETSEAFNLIRRIEVLEDVAGSLPEQDRRRHALLGIVRCDLAAAPALRPRIAAQLLELSEKTVRAWADEGILIQAEGSSRRRLLDMTRVHLVLHLVRELRASGKVVGLVDEVHRRLVDATWLERTDLAESLEQMGSGEGTTRVEGTPP